MNLDVTTCIILSDFQQYRTLLAKVIQFFVSPEKCESQRYEVLTPDRRYDIINQTFFCLQSGFYYEKKCNIVTDVGMTSQVPAKVLWSYHIIY